MKRIILLLLSLSFLLFALPVLHVSAAVEPKVGGPAITCPGCGHYPLYASATDDYYETVYQTCPNSETRVHFHQYWYNRYDYVCANCGHLTSESHFDKQLCQLTNFASLLEEQ